MEGSLGISRESGKSRRNRRTGRDLYFLRAVAALCSPKLRSPDPVLKQVGARNYHEGKNGSNRFYRSSPNSARQGYNGHQSNDS